MHFRSTLQIEKQRCLGHWNAEGGNRQFYKGPPPPQYIRQIETPYIKSDRFKTPTTTYALQSTLNKNSNYQDLFMASTLPTCPLRTGNPDATRPPILNPANFPSAERASRAAKQNDNLHQLLYDSCEAIEEWIEKEHSPSAAGDQLLCDCYEAVIGREHGDNCTTTEWMDEARINTRTEENLVASVHSSIGMHTDQMGSSIVYTDYMGSPMSLSVWSLEVHTGQMYSSMTSDRDGELAPNTRWPPTKDEEQVDFIKEYLQRAGPWSSEEPRQLQLPQGFDVRPLFTVFSDQ